MTQPLSQSLPVSRPRPARPSPQEKEKSRSLGRLGQRLRGLVVRWPEKMAGVVEGVSLVVRVPEGQLRIVPLEALEGVFESAGEVSLRASIEPHSFPRHRSLRRMDGGWRVDVSVDVPTMDADYWLAHCGGFLVNAPNKDMGVVEDVLFEPGGKPETLLVRTGGLRGRTVALGVTEVVEIVPERRTIGIERDLRLYADEPRGVRPASAARRDGWEASHR
jgi:hypothetical protein